MKVLPTSFGLSRCAGEASHDVFAVQAWDETVIAVLADGSGSSEAAREAAERTVHSLVSNYASRPRSWSPQKALTEFTRRINRTLHQDSLSRFGEPELITTLSVAVVEGDRLYGLNVGDSRVYLAREGALTCLSCDHVAGANELQHVLARAIGLAPEVEPHWFEAELKDGDVAFLCSDGVYNVLDESVLANQLSARSAARAIVSEAREQGKEETRDDLSAIVLSIQTTGKAHTERALPLAIPGTLRAGEVVDGFKLERSLQPGERVWLATRVAQTGAARSADFESAVSRISNPQALPGSAPADSKSAIQQVGNLRYEGAPDSASARVDERFVLKFAPLEARENEDVANRFVEEVWNASRLQDTRFFPRAFVPEHATACYYAMEFVEAPSLHELLGSRRLSADETVTLGKFLLNAAQYLLSFDLVHGDFKPENILVVAGLNGLSFKLIDFGSVTAVFSVTSRAGTASYLAPERFHGTPISERTELFSLGVTLYEGLTRAFPFGEIERFQTPRFHAPRRPGALNPNLPPWLEAVVLRAISPEAERRYQHYSEMLFDLEHPDRVAPFFAEDLPLIERDPLRFYRTGFYLLLALVVTLICLLLHPR